ncbi:hypothetical protein R3W88_004366 [Solanum pinnatisectum]|uniref:RNase H type-1 domain-containing protein n=1 Tax=Solanum pinnatisectum TaxID=50273 RepID=A0AAV9K927_9SOLN|nr:hypothetical protein R3W88_004366 [Solanum pinnatisectum]
MEHTPLTNPIRAELQAMWMGLMLVVEQNLNPPEINTDSSEANMIQNNNLLYDDVIIECRYLMKKLGAKKLTYIFRDQNRVSDTLARKGEKELVISVQTILTIPPIIAQKEVDADTLGTSYSRTTNNETNISQGRDVTQTIGNDHHSVMGELTLYMP